MTDVVVRAPMTDAPDGRAAPDAAVTAAMAHLHLRTGLPALALVELETLGGLNALDAATLADLAEARWRSGDLAEAGEAAQAHLDRGGSALLAQVVTVEANAAAGRQREARQLASRITARADIDEATLDAIFAGRPRSNAWPALAPGHVTPSVQARPSPPDPLAAAEAALARGDAATAAVTLAMALREEPALAALVLALAERGVSGGASGSTPGGLSDAALQLVRGDALRLLGRSNEATAAFQRARRALEAAASREDTP